MPTYAELLTKFQRDSADVVSPQDVTASSAPKKKTYQELIDEFQGPTIGEAQPEKPVGISHDQFLAENIPLAASGVPGVSTLGAVKLLADRINGAVESSSSQAQEFLKPIQEQDQYGLGPFALAGRIAIGGASGLAGIVTSTADRLLNPELRGENSVEAAGGMVGDMAHSLRGTPFQLAELARQIPQSMGIPDSVSEKMNLPAIILDKIGEVVNAPMGDVGEFKKEQVAAQRENPAVGVGNAAMIGGILAGIGGARTTLPKIGERPAYNIPGLGSETPDNPIWTGDKKAPVNMIDNAPDVSPAPNLITRQGQIEKALEAGGGDFPSAQKIGTEAVPLGIESAARTFERNPALKEIVYRPAQDAVHNSNLRKVAEETEFNDVLKANDIGMTNRTASSNAIGEYAIAQQKGGVERLALEGKTAPELKPNEMAIYDHMRSGFEKHWRLMNKVRTSIGLDPIGYVENYFTFAQALDEMAQSGVNPVLADPKAIMARASQIAEETAMKNIKSRGSELKPLKTDAFGIYRNYIESAIKYEELTPHINRVNQLLDGTYGMDMTTRPNVTVKVGRRVPDYTLGKENKLSAPPRRAQSVESAGPDNPLYRRDPNEPITPQPTSTPSLFRLGDIQEKPRAISPYVSKNRFQPSPELPSGQGVVSKTGGVKIGKTPKRGTPPEGAIPLSEKYPNMAAYTKSWLNDIAGIKPVKGLNANLESWVGRIQRNITRSALSFNVISTLIQPTALVPAFSELGPRYLTEGVTLIGPGSKWRKIAMEKSKVLLGREYETAIADATAGIRGRAENLMSGAGDAGLKLLKLGDLETARATWVGAYRKGVNQFGLSDANAIKYADDVVIRTQGSASPIDRAPIQRSQLGRAASMFGTYTMNNWGYITRDLLGRGAVKRNAAAQVNAIVQYGLANQLVNTIYGKYSPQPNPLAAIEQYKKDHPKDRSNKDLLAGMMEFWKVVPIVGGGVRYGNVQPGGPIAGLGSDILTGGLFKKPVSTLGRLGGIPGTVQAQKIIDESKKKKKKKAR